VARSIFFNTDFVPEQQPTGTAQQVAAPAERALYDDLATRYNVPVNVLRAISERKTGPVARGLLGGPVLAAERNAQALKRYFDQGLTVEQAVRSEFGNDEEANQSLLRARQLADTEYAPALAPPVMDPAAPVENAKLPGTITPEGATATVQAETPFGQDSMLGIVGGAYNSVGSAVRALGKVPQALGDYVTTPLINAAMGTDYRTGNLLDPAADVIQDFAEDTKALVSAETKQAMADSTPDGDLFDPSTWTLGKNPSIEGYMALSADVMGSLVPVIAASVATGGVAAPAAVGGLQGGGEGIETARAIVNQAYQDGTLEKESAYFRELIANGYAPEDALQRTTDAAELLAGTFQAPLSALGGGLTSKIINPAEKILSRSGLGQRIAGRAALGAVEEGTQEVLEGMAAKGGTALATGLDVDLTQGSFADFILSLAPGAVPAGIAGALSKRETGPKTPPPPKTPTRPKEAPSPDYPTAPRRSAFWTNKGFRKAVKKNWDDWTAATAKNEEYRNKRAADEPNPAEFDTFEEYVSAADEFVQAKSAPLEPEIVDDPAAPPPAAAPAPQAGESDVIDAYVEALPKPAPTPSPAAEPDAATMPSGEPPVSAANAAPVPVAGDTAEDGDPDYDAAMASLGQEPGPSGFGLGTRVRLTSPNMRGDVMGEIVDDNDAGITIRDENGDDYEIMRDELVSGQITISPATDAQPQPDETVNGNRVPDERGQGPVVPDPMGGGVAAGSAFVPASDALPSGDAGAGGIGASGAEGVSPPGARDGQPAGELTAPEPIAPVEPVEPVTPAAPVPPVAAKPAKEIPADKWFGSLKAANEYIAKMGAAETHEPVKAGARVEIRPKAAAAPVAPELVTVKDVYGDTHRVLKADLDGDKPMLRRYDANGQEVMTADRGRVLRENLDLTGEKAKAAYADVDVIARAGKDGDLAFKDQGSVTREIKRMGQDPADFDILPNPKGEGFYGKRRVPAAVAPVDAAAHEAATSPLNALPEPTEAQKEAGNYKVGRVKRAGFDISIENPVGSTRTGKDQDGKEWSSTMKSHYGRILGTKGADKEHIDAFIKPGEPQGRPGDAKAFIINQIDPRTGKFDEHKVMFGYGSVEEAKAAYQENYDKDWKGLGDITEVAENYVKFWADRHDTTKPFKLGADPKPHLAREERRAAKEEAEMDDRRAAKDALMAKRQEKMPPVEDEPALTSYYAGLIDRYDAAVRAGDSAAFAEAEADIEAAERKINGGQMGMALRESAAGKMRARVAAPIGAVPKWGQDGIFEKTVDGVKFIIKSDARRGMSSIYAADPDGLFPSKTGYRSMTSIMPSEDVSTHWENVLRKVISSGKLVKPETAYDMPSSWDEGGPRQKAPAPTKIPADASPDFAEALRGTKVTTKPAVKAADGFSYRIKPEGSGYIAMRMSTALGQPPKYLRAPTGKPWTEDEAISHVVKMQPAPAAPAATKAPGERTFTTAKGSTYVVHDDGTTSRDKAFRPEHGEKEQGPQPRSERTLYVTPEAANILGEIQTKGAGGRSIVQTVAGKQPKIGIRYLDGPSAGKVERRTEVDVSIEPAMGMVPVELWDNGTKVHFGNPITKMGNFVVPEKPAAAPAPKAEVVSVGFQPKVIGKNSRGETIREDKNGVRSRSDGKVSVQETVQLIPKRGGGFDYSRSALDDEFKTVEELAAEKSAADNSRKSTAENTADIDSKKPQQTAENNSRPNSPEPAAAAPAPDFSDMRKAAAGPANTAEPTYTPEQQAIVDRFYDADEALIAAQAAWDEGIDRIPKEIVAVSEGPGKWGDRNKKVDELRAESNRLRNIRDRALTDKVRAISEADAAGVDTRKLPFRRPAPAKLAVSANTIFTEDAAAKARALIKAKLKGNQLNSGIDPELMQAGITLAGYHIEKGARSFAAYAAAMIEDLGDVAKPYLKSWYMAVRFDPRAAGFDGMSPSSEVESADVDAISATQESEDVRGEDQEAPPGVPAEEVRSPEGSGDVGVDNPAAGEAGGGAEAGADAVGVSGTRGGRGDQRGDSVPDAGSGQRPVRGGKRRGRSPVAEDDGGPGDGRLDLGPPVAPLAPNIPVMDFKITDDVGLGTGGEVAKFNDNVAAIRVLKALEAENRRATPDEQRTLARYVGWGGLANAFPDPTTGVYKDAWAKRGPELAELLTPEEFKQARRSTPNAHYTSKTVVDAMWSAARRLGFRGGLALETSMGSGNFLGLKPADLDAHFVGIEYDSLTARIAAALYPQATVLHSGFQKVPLPDNTFDLSIGNPPFGSNSLRFQYRPEINRESIHNQFFRASMAAVKPGGYQIMVVSRFLMDAQDNTSRMGLAKEAKLIAAIRLPDTAFKENARTEVVTDIIILQKLTEEEKADLYGDVEAPDTGKSKAKKKDAPKAVRFTKIPDWVNTVEVPDPLGGDPITVNKYFADRPRQILGVLERSGSMARGKDVTVRLDDPSRLPEMLATAVARLPERSPRVYDPVAAIERHKSMSEALRISLSGDEPGAIALTPDGKLKRTIERMTPGGTFELAHIEVTADTPWADSLMRDVDGGWHHEVEVKGPDGKAVKVLDENGRPTRNNQREIVVYKTDADVPSNLRLGKTGFDRLTRLAVLRDVLRRQIVMETQDAPSGEMEANRARLKKLYDEYVKKHGPVNRAASAKLANTMPDGGLLLALEFDYSKPIAADPELGTPAQAEKWKPAPIMSARVVLPYKPATDAATPADALLIAMAETGRVNIARVAELLKTTPDAAAARLQEGEKPLIFRDPETNLWETADAYLSGQVRRKLEAAKAAGLERNIAALEAVQPVPWTAEQVTVIIGSSWVPEKDYSAFLDHLLGGKSVVRYQAATNSFSVTINGAKQAKLIEWSTDGIRIGDLISNMLNSRQIRITYTDSEGKTHLDAENTKRAQIKAKEIENEFAEWVFAEPERRARLVKLFNDKFNTRVTRQHDGSHLILPGKVPDAVVQMRRHQKNVIWRGISERFLLMDHTVGAGKTFAAIARAMERRRMGLSRKPMFVVPNHLVGQWEADFYRLYPGAKVLAATKADFKKERRRRLFAKIATGDFDAVVIAHSSFGFVGIAPETEERYLEQELETALKAIEAAQEQAAEDGHEGRGKPIGVKEAERLLAKIEARMAGLREGKQDRLLTFEQLGVDDMTIDEAHEFKNLFYSSRMSNVRGMGDKTGSAKANDLYNKVRVLRETPTGTVTFLTGTPISNSAVEMYTMMRYLAADQLKELGLEHFDAWRAQYVTASPGFEMSESGRLKEVTRLGRTWSNMRSLIDLYYQFTDAVSLDDIKRWYMEDKGKPFPVPNAKGGERQSVVVDPTGVQERMLESLLEDFDDLQYISDVKERNAERLRLMDRARKLSLDPRAVEPGLVTNEPGKLGAVSDNIKRIYDKWDADKGTQLVFLDRSVPKSKGDDKIIKEYDELIEERDEALRKGDDIAYGKVLDKLEEYNASEIEALRDAQNGGWNAYQQIKDNLIAQGVPANEIRFIQEANNDEQKKALFDAVNQGRVRVLIGSTPRMGAGTNVQKLAVALHHVDVTWKPSDIEQREGRVIRQGNDLLDKYGIDKFEVEILAYVTKRTVDAKMWELSATKLRMINGIRNYNGEFTMEFEDDDAVSMSEIAALASDNPLLLERVKLDLTIGNLEVAERGYRRRKFGLQDELARIEDVLANNPGRIAREKAKRDLLAPGWKAMQDAMRKRAVTVAGKTFSLAEGDPRSIIEEAQEYATQAIEEAKGGDENARYSVIVNDRRYTNAESIEAAIESALGDGSPFEVTIEGATHRHRTHAGRALAEFLTKRKDDFAGDGEFLVGEFMGQPLRVSGSIDPNAKGGEARVEFVLWMGDKSSIEQSEEKSFNATAGGPSTITGSSALLSLSSKAIVLAQGSNVATYERQMAAAKESESEVREKSQQPFAKEDELKSARTRLKEIIDILDATSEKSGKNKGQPRDEDKLSALVDREPFAYDFPDTAALDRHLRAGKHGKLIGALIDSGKIKLVENIGQVMPRPNTGRPFSAITHWTGQVSLVSQNLTKENAEAITMHEVFHAGMKSLLGDRAWAGLNKRLTKLFDAALDRERTGQSLGAYAPFWRAVAKHVEEVQTPPQHYGDEMGAYAVSMMMEKSAGMPPGVLEIIRAIVDKVKAWALRTFGTQLGALTPGQLQALTVSALRGWEIDTQRMVVETEGDRLAVIVTPPPGTPPGNEEAERGWLRDRIESTSTDLMPALLATIPMRPLFEEIGKDITSLADYLKTKQAMDTMRDTWHAETDKLAQKWLSYRSKNATENARLMDLMHATTIAQVDPSKPFVTYLNARDDAALKSGRPGLSLDIALSKLDTDDRRRAQYDGFKEEFDGLSEAAQDLYNEVRDMYTKLADEQDAILLANLTKANDRGMIEATKKHAKRMQSIKDRGLTGQERTDAINAADAELADEKSTNAWRRRARITRLREQFEMQRLKGPYFPLARFGDLFVSIRDEDGQMVSFSRFEKAIDQTRFIDQMKKENPTYNIDSGVLDEGEKLRGAVDAGFVADIEDILDASGVDKQTKNEVWQRYLETFPDMSLRKNRIHRSGREGYVADALRAFGNHMFHGAHQTARLKYAIDLEGHLEAAREETAKMTDPKKRTRAQMVVNEAQKRNAFVMNPTGGAVAQYISTIGFVYHLGVSPAAALVNLSQTLVMGAPILAAYQGTVGGGMTSALKHLHKALWDFTRSKGRIENATGLSVDEKAAMHMAYESGLIERTQSHDLAAIGDSGVAYNPTRTKIMGYIAYAFHHAERLNREVTFMAAYRMAREKGRDHGLAIEDASDLTWKAHFDYQNTSRPRIMQNDTAKVFLMFRNYNINMLFRLFRDTHQMINAKDPQERKEALIQLGGITAMMMFSAGVKGTWLLAPALMFAAMFFGGEGDDPEQLLRKGMTDILPGWMVGPIMDGVPGYLSGIALSERIGMPNLWFRNPDRQLEGKDIYLYWLGEAAGPAFAPIQNLIVGASVAAEGNVQRGVETAMPKFVKDMMRSYRFWSEGALTMKGDDIINPMTTMDIVRQALGFTPAKLAEQYDRNGAMKNKEAVIVGRRGDLLTRVWRSETGRSSETIDEILPDIQEFNEDYPEYPITPKTIRQSMQSRERASDRNEGGIQINPKLNERIRGEAPATIYR